MTKKYSKSKSSARRASGGKKKTSKKSKISPKKIALFKHYMGAKPEAEQPVNLNRNPSDTTHRR